MKKDKPSKKVQTIRAKIQLIMTVLLVAQLIIFISGLFVISIPNMLDTYSYTLFAKIVQNRKIHIENEMVDQWSDISYPAEEILDHYNNKIGLESSLSYDNLVSFFDESVSALTKMFDDNKANGAFIIIDDDQTTENMYSCMYLHNEYPFTAKKNIEGLQMLKGPAKVAEKYGINLAQNWSQGLLLDEFHHAILERPLSAEQDRLQETSLSPFFSPFTEAEVSSDSGYWHISPSLFNKETSMMTFSLPLTDKNGKTFGVVGITIEQTHLYKFLPIYDYTKKSLGYFLAEKDGEQLIPRIIHGSQQESIFDLNVPITVEMGNDLTNSLLYKNGQQKIVLQAEELTVYANNSYFEDNKLYLVGATSLNSIEYFSIRLNGMVFFIIILTLIFAFVISYHCASFLTSPIRKLNKYVNEHLGEDVLFFKSTGIKEIDNLSYAIEELHNASVEKTTRNDRILKLVRVKIGTFEYNSNTEYVQISSTLAEMFDFRIQLENKHRILTSDFDTILHEIERNIEPLLENTYKVRSNPDTWYQVKYFEENDTVYGVVMDVSTEVKAAKVARYESNHDMLTGIYNRQHFFRKAHRIIVSNELKTSAVVLFDLDNLKITNDTYGHEMGDIYIKTFAHILVETFREDVVVARMAGDEFLAFFYNFDSKEEILNLINNAYKAFSAMSITTGSSVVTIRASSGLSWYGEHSIDLKELVRYADIAMYKGKHTEKGRLVVFDPSFS